MRRLFVLILLLHPFLLFAQNDNYGGFMQEAWKEYEDFRMQCNIEYAEFMKSAWKEYGVKPPIPVPEMKKVPVQTCKPGSVATASVCVETEEVPMLPMDDVQPVPICKIPEMTMADLSGVSLGIDSLIGADALMRLLPDMKVEKHGGLFRFKRKKPARDARQDVRQEAQKETQQQETPQQEEVEAVYRELPFMFFGTELKVRVLEDFRFRLESCDVALLSDAWKLLSTPRFNNTIRDCLELRYDYNMCDWAYLEMLQSMADAWLGKGTNEAIFLAAYIYCQSGYQMRFAKSGNKLYMLVASKHFMYDRYFLVIDGQDYFTVSNVDAQTRLEVCDTHFQNEARLSLFIPKSVTLNNDLGDYKDVKSTLYTDVAMHVRVNKNLIDFYDKYPTSEVDNNFMTRWAMYANTPVDESVKKQIYPSLKEKLAGKTTEEGVHALMHMLQTGLEYGYDEDAWGHDRAFFAEETLYYPTCDCEDKSILFSHLVRDLYGLKTLLVYFPGHLLTAVHFEEEVNGLYCMYEGEKYVFCDPTFKGAGIGRIYPEYEGEKPSVILLVGNE